MFLLMFWIRINRHNYNNEGGVMCMDNLFDIKNYDSYKEDNRREVKRREVVYLCLYGNHTLQWRMLMAVLLFLAFKN